MLSSIIFLVALLTSAVKAHFQLEFPSPRGLLNDTTESSFCGGYSTASSNRTRFPLSGGYVKASYSTNWTAGIFISTTQNPTKLGDFVQINGFASGANSGNYCLPLDFSKSSLTNLTAGQNLTIQVVWESKNTSQPRLYQCADVTLATGLNLSSIVTCPNTLTPVNTTSSNTTSASTSSSATASPKASSTSTSSAMTDFAKPITFVTTLGALAGLILW